MKTPYLAVIWYQRRGGRQRWYSTDHMTYDGALRWVMDSLWGWSFRPSITTTATIIERQLP